MIKKRIFALCALAALSLSLLTGCGSGGETSSAPVEESQSVQQSDPAGETSQPPEETEPGQESQPAQNPAPADGQVDLAAFAQSVLENHDFPAMEKADPADEELGAIMLGNYYPGLTDLDLEQAEIYLAMISFTGGELSLAQSKNADDAAKLKAIFQARIDAKTTDGIGNYPEELETWQRSSRLVENGNYLMLVCNEDCDAIEAEFNALFQ